MRFSSSLQGAGITAVLVTGLSLGAVATSHAQQAPAAAPSAAPALPPLPAASHLQAARDVIVLSGVSSSFTNIYTDFLVNMRQNFVTRPELTKDLEASFAALKPESDKRVEDMIAAASVVFARTMTEAELKEITTFLNSPVGRKYNQARPQMINEIYKQLEPWTFRTSDYFYNFTRDEMKKRGHDIGG
ncbi:MAG: DUF2059 domain-containing protein [Bosea sp. (in: a-proteobacteria)]